MKQSGKRQPASCFSPKNLPLAKKSCLDQAGKGGHGRQVRIQETRIMCSTKHEKGKTGKEDMHSLWIKAQLSLLRKLDWSKLWKRCILTDTERKRLSSFSESFVASLLKSFLESLSAESFVTYLYESLIESLLHLCQKVLLHLCPVVLLHPFQKKLLLSCICLDKLCFILFLER